MSGFILDVDETAMAQGDPAHLRRVIENLVDNARRDQGPGFPPDFVPHATAVAANRPGGGAVVRIELPCPP